jgi:ribokinase
MHPKICVIGSSNTDMVILTPRIPMPGETILGGTFFMNPGGKGANQAVAAARLGGQVTLVARVGQDVFGEQALAGFQKDGIDTQFISTDTEHPSGVALINVDAQGENSITVAAGANEHLLPAQVEPVLAHLSPADLVLMQLETPLDTIWYVAAHCARAGIRCVLNPAPAQNLPAELLGQLYLLTPNETEASLLTGIAVTDLDSAKKAAQHLQKKGVKNVIITLGAKGALVVDEHSEQLIPTPKVEPVDSTAAGDCFNGALCVALSEGMDLAAAATFACKAASISVTRLGAQASMPRREEV